MMKLFKYLVMGIAALIAISLGFAVLGLAVGLAGGLAEDDALAGDRVLDRVACVDHELAPLVG